MQIHNMITLFILNVRNIKEYFVKYYQSHITLLWIWIMLCDGTLQMVYVGVNIVIEWLWICGHWHSCLGGMVKIYHLEVYGCFIPTWLDSTNSLNINFFRGHMWTYEWLLKAKPSQKERWCEDHNRYHRVPHKFSCQWWWSHSQYEKKVVHKRLLWSRISSILPLLMHCYV